MALGLIIGSVAVLLVITTILLSIVINQEYERAVVFRLGGFNRVLGPGLQFKIPFLEWTQKVDYRQRSINVRPQKVMTKDNVTTQVDALIFYSVKRDKEELKKAILEVDDFEQVTVDYGQSMLRAIIGKKELDEILQNREDIADELKTQLDAKTDEFGIEVDDVEIKDVSIPDNMERAMAAEAEAERERRARITNAQGEVQAAVRTRIASDMLGEKGYQLRTLQTVDSVGQESNTIVLAPANLMGGGNADGEEAMFGGMVDQLKDNVDIDSIVDNLNLEGEDLGKIAQEVADNQEG